MVAKPPPQVIAKRTKKTDCFYAFKIILIILGVVLATTMCVTTVFNCYRVYLLQSEVSSLKVELSEIKKLQEEAKRRTRMVDEFVPGSEKLPIQRRKRDDTIQLKKHMLEKTTESSNRVNLKTKAVTAIDRMLGDDPYGDLSDQEYQSDNGYHSRRRFRPRVGSIESLDERPTIPKVGRIKPLPTVHYNGDTSRYVVGENYKGDGHVRHDTNYIDWKPSNWVNTLGMDEYFSLRNHSVRIRESGLYLIYAQIYYLTVHDTNGFRVFKNEEMVLQCTTTVHSVERKFKGNTCFTAGAEYLSDGDEISLGDVEKGRYTLYEQGKSFFGMVKLGDVKIK